MPLYERDKSVRIISRGDASTVRVCDSMHDYSSLFYISLEYECVVCLILILCECVAHLPVLDIDGESKSYNWVD